MDWLVLKVILQLKFLKCILEKFKIFFKSVKFFLMLFAVRKPICGYTMIFIHFSHTCTVQDKNFYSLETLNTFADMKRPHSMVTKMCPKTVTYTQFKGSH